MAHYFGFLLAFVPPVKSLKPLFFFVLFCFVLVLVLVVVLVVVVVVQELNFIVQ